MISNFEKKYKLVHFCVLYGDPTHALELLNSLKRQMFDFINWPIAFVMINNNENTELPFEIQHFEFQDGIDFIILQPNQNLGYFGAAEWARKQFQLSDWTVVSNTDLIFGKSDFFDALSSKDVLPSLGVIAPSIISEISNQDQNPYMMQRPQNQKMQALKWIFTFDLTSYLYQSFSAIKNSKKQITGKTMASCEIYAPHGSFIIFYKNYFNAGQTFSHRPFLFGEEITVAENLRNQKLKAVYFPALTIRHQEHQSTGRIPNRKMRKFIGEASRYCAEEFFQD